MEPKKETRGAPRIMAEAKAMSVSFEREIYRQIAFIAANNGKSKAQVVRELVSKSIKKDLKAVE